MLQDRGNTSVRKPAVCGLFYPEDPRELRDVVSEYLRQQSAVASAPPKALIVPHAGYLYSGGIAAAAYATVVSLRRSVRRIVLIGPSHRVYLRGMAVPTATTFATPLGRIEIDRELTLPGEVQQTVDTGGAARLFARKRRFATQDRGARDRVDLPCLLVVVIVTEIRAHEHECRRVAPHLRERRSDMLGSDRTEHDRQQREVVEQHLQERQLHFQAMLLCVRRIGLDYVAALQEL
jgi:hypothetical protein